MHLATLNAPAPAPGVTLRTVDTRPASSVLWRVVLRPLGRPVPWAWQGWAHDSEDARRVAVDDARQTWPGYSFVVLAVLQVNT